MLLTQQKYNQVLQWHHFNSAPCPGFYYSMSGLNQLIHRQQNCIYYTIHQVHPKTLDIVWLNLQLFSHYIFTWVSALEVAARIIFITLFLASAVSHWLGALLPAIHYPTIHRTQTYVTGYIQFGHIVSLSLHIKPFKKYFQNGYSILSILHQNALWWAK